MKRKTFYLELLCRSLDKEDYHVELGNMKLGRPDSHPLYIPVHYAWQEDPNDLHIQIEDDGENLRPVTHEESGDYIIPATPWLLKHLRKGFKPAVVKGYDFGSVVSDGVLVYHFGWMAEPADYHEDDSVVATRAYLKVLDKAWAMF
jgi:hypothetical protein